MTILTFPDSCAKLYHPFSHTKLQRKS